ncbi:hypothetical protein M422DRAFT_27251 [Sphaerobolus stellatus SS14]|nr:hypothetical protein M422DRAFT_27251 [Sphaerobolus stellatus SS14]
MQEENNLTLHCADAGDSASEELTSDETLLQSGSTSKKRGRGRPRKIWNDDDCVKARARWVDNTHKKRNQRRAEKQLNGSRRVDNLMVFDSLDPMEPLKLS